MGTYIVRSKSGVPPLPVEIAGTEPTPDEIKNIITPAFERHAKDYLANRGVQSPVLTMSPVQAGIAAGAAGGMGGLGAIAGVMADPLSSAPRPAPNPQDATAVAISRLSERERNRMLSERVENIIQQGVPAVAGMAMGGVGGVVAKTPLFAKTIGQLAEAGVVRRGLGLAGRVGVNVGSGLVGSAATDYYRSKIQDKVDKGELPASFLRPDFKAADYQHNAIWDLAIGGALEGGMSAFQAVRRGILRVPKESEIAGDLAAARDLSIDMNVSDVTKSKLLGGFGRIVAAMPIIGGIVKKSRDIRVGQVVSAYEKVLGNPFAPRSMFSELGVDLEHSLRRDTNIILDNVDYKLNLARQLSNERNVQWDNTEILEAVDKALTSRSDLTIPTTFTRTTGPQESVTRRVAASETAPSFSDKRGFVEDVAAGTGPQPVHTKRVMAGETGSVTTTKVATDKTVTMSGGVPDFVGDTNVDEWMVALGGMDPTTKLNASNILDIKSNIVRAWKSGSLSHEQQVFLYDLERATDRMLTNSPDPEVAKLIKDGWSDLAAFKLKSDSNAARKFEQLDANIFQRSSKVIPGGKYSDELFEQVTRDIGNGQHGSQHMRDLKDLMGPELFGEAVDSFISRTGQKHLHKMPDGTIEFDWKGLRADLHLGDTAPSLGREGLDTALRYSGRDSLKKIGENLDFLEKTFGKQWIDPATMGMRRFTIGGARAVSSMLTAGALTGAAFGGGHAGILIAVELGLLGRYLNSPKALQTILQASRRDLTDAALLNAQRSMVEMYATDLVKQYSGRETPTQDEIEDAKRLIIQSGGLPEAVMSPTPMPGFLPNARGGVENLMSIPAKVKATADYLRGK